MPRRNLCTNPAAKNNATGWSGNSAPARVTGLSGFPVGTGMKSTGAGFIQSPTGACAAGDQLVVSFYQQSSTVLGSKTVYAAFTRSAGGDDFSQTFSTTLDGTVRRSTATVTAPANATGVYLVLDGVGADVVMTAVMIEPGATDGGYADGDTAGWAWDGADGNSTSTEQSPVTVTPTGIAVPVGIGQPAAALLGATTAGIAVAAAAGTPSTALTVVAAPAALSVPAVPGAPSSALVAVTPAGIAMPVATGQPAASLARSAQPTGLAVATGVGSPSTFLPPAGPEADGLVIRTSSRLQLLRTESRGA